METIAADRGSVATAVASLQWEERQLAAAIAAARTDRGENMPKSKNDTGVLAGGVQLVKSIIRGRCWGFSALAGVLVSVDGPGSPVVMRSTDLETTITTVVPVSVDCPVDGYRALVPAADLAAALKHAPADGLEFGPSGPAEFKVGSTRIRTLPVDDFPRIPDVVSAGRYIDGLEFAGAMAAVASFTSDDVARPVLTAVRLEVRADGILELAATDSYTLGVAEIAADGLETIALVPAAAAKIAAKIAAKYSGRIAIHSAPEHSVMEFAIGSTVIQSRTIDGEFPNYRQLIPEPATSADVDRGRLEFGPEFLEDIAAAADFIGRENTPVRLELNSSVELSASLPDRGILQRTVAGARWTGPELSVAYNPRYLARTLAAVPAADTLEIRDGLKPACLRAGGRVGLLMPVRIPAPVA